METSRSGVSNSPVRHLDLKKAFSLNGKIKLVIGSPQFDRRNVDLIAREIGAKVVLLSPLEKDFLPAMRNFAQILSEVME